MRMPHLKQQHNPFLLFSKEEISSFAKQHTALLNL